MRRFVLALLLSALPTFFFAQEVVVFKDYRSLPVLGHRVDGDWTFFRLQGGELAVLSSSILEIRKEPARPQGGSSARPTPPAAPERPHPGFRTEPTNVPQPPVQFQQPVPDQPPSFNKLDDDDDDSTSMGDESDDDDADENQPAMNKPPGPPNRPVGFPQQPEEPANTDEK
jgi:hypothetical protein